MAYNSANLSSLAYANGFTLWHYRSSDAIGDIDASGYFDAASNVLRVGDFVLVNAGIGVVPAHGLMVVVSNTGGVVDLSNATAFGTGNTD